MIGSYCLLIFKKKFPYVCTTYYTRYDIRGEKNLPGDYIIKNLWHKDSPIKDGDVEVAWEGNITGTTNLDFHIHN